jgi:glycosyltransferase involved in cell wall biosynthesis
MNKKNKNAAAPKPLDILDIVVSMYNQEKLIERVLVGIFQNTTTPFNLNLVFDGCTDRTKEVALAFIEKAKAKVGQGGAALLRDLRTADAPNVFETRANNAGFRMTTTDYIIAVQDDVVIEERGWERRMTYPLRSWDDVFAVSGRAAMNMAIDAAGDVAFSDMAAAESFSLPRRSFEIRSVINRGPIALRADILRKLDCLDEAFAPGYFDEADLVLRARTRFAMACGAIRVGWHSDAAWGKTRVKGSGMNANSPWVRNALRLRERYPDLVSGDQPIVEQRPIRDAQIDWRGRDSLMTRAGKRIRADWRAARWQIGRKWHALKIRLKIKN